MLPGRFRGGLCGDFCNLYKKKKIQRYCSTPSTSTSRPAPNTHASSVASLAPRVRRLPDSCVGTRRGPRCQLADLLLFLSLLLSVSPPSLATTRLGVAASSLSDAVTKCTSQAAPQAGFWPAGRGKSLGSTLCQDLASSAMVLFCSFKH